MGTLVIGLGKPKGEPDGDEEDAMDEEDGGDAKSVRKSAYRDLVKAIKSGDMEAGEGALRDFVTACDYEEE